MPQNLSTLNPIVGQQIFIIRFAAPLTNAGGTINLQPGAVAFPLTLGSGESSYFVGPIREVLSGTVTAVPLPAAAPLFLAAIALLALGKRKNFRGELTYLP